jgi:flavin reductase ActVB
VRDMSLRVLRSVRGLFPCGVTIVTTTDACDKPHGFTASSFNWLSLAPPLVTVSLARTATCFPFFCAAEGFAVNVLHSGHKDLALRFASQGVDKFDGAGFTYGDGRHPALVDALAVLICRTVRRPDGGDHMMLVGEVTDHWSDVTRRPIVQYRDAFHELALADAGSTSATG